jgi:hypothetical protein
VGYRVGIQHNWYVNGAAIFIGRRISDDRYERLVLGGHGRHTWEVADPAASPDGPTLSIDEDLARALMQKLVEHFGGLPSDAQTRADYNHERARVDKFIAYLVSSDRTAT